MTPAEGTTAGDRPVERPETAEALARLVRAAAEERVPLLPVGEAHALAVGGLPEAASTRVEFSLLSRIVDLTPGDLTVTVQAGVRLVELHAALREHGLYLPGGGCPKGTIGGLLASGYTSLEAGLLHGALRERVLGLSVVDGRGTLSRSGGRVVKNVTGYDLHRMHAGPGGALGFLVELTLRLEPLPEERAHVRLRLPDVAAAEAAWQAIRRSGPEVATTVLVPVRGDTPEYSLDLYLAGDREVVAAAERWLEDRFRPALESRERGEMAGTPQALESAPGANWQVALRVAPAAWRSALARMQDLAASFDSRSLGHHVLPDLGVVRWAAESDSVEPLGQAVATMAAAGGWQYRVENEGARTASWPAWSADPAALRLLGRLKEEIDPAGVLRPGSYSARTLERAAAFFEERQAIVGKTI